MSSEKNPKCPKCGGGIINSIHFAFCQECDWDVGMKIEEADKQMLKRMLRSLFDDDDDE